MREINIGSKQIRIKATPLALLYYKQEFKSDLLGDLVKMQVLTTDPSKLDSVALLQLIWAMAKADAHPEKFPSFEEWLSTLEGFDFSDSDVLSAALEEAADGFFRRGKQGQIKK
ncbi:MAG: hypothetical protein Q8911_01270 [Bacillota bacterium]|nr:hypothetical protein [Bacillota bacterium]